jgi:predicted DNA-binding transcriptional regulator AlpA
MNSTSTKRNTNRRIVRYPELKSEFGIDWTFQHVSRLSRAGKFPPKVVLGYRSVGWFADAVEGWLAEREAA